MPQVFMPRLSDTMTEGTVSTWTKGVGDRIEKGDVIAEIETDKATMELEAYDAGVLEQILVDVGKTVPIGEVIAVIGDGSGAATAPAAASRRRPRPQTTEPVVRAPADSAEPTAVCREPHRPRPHPPAPSARRAQRRRRPPMASTRSRRRWRARSPVMRVSTSPPSRAQAPAVASCGPTFSTPSPP